MARRKVDVSMLQGLVEGSAHQEIIKGARKSTDPNFPVFATPVNQDILVYIPRTNITTTENGEDMQVLKAHLHDYKLGNSYGQLRCINGLGGNPAFDELGYDGTCPGCDAMKEVWDLYRKKMETEAARLGIDPQNDPNDTLKPIRETILKERDIKDAEEYVTFPIVIIPTKGKMQPTDDALENLQPTFVTWRKKRYEDSILSALDTMMVNPGHPAGMFWFWKFSYDTQGKQATARDSAKNAKYTPITDGSALEILNPYKDGCEESAKDFTLIKAAEVVVANEFIYKEDMEAEVNKIMTKTRQFLDLSGMNGVAQIGAGQAQGQIGAGQNPLANFNGDAKTGTPQNLGTGNPIKFGE